ncbi:unnamed protein product [Closterium sp. NIES-54]
MASLRVLAFDHEGHPIQFDTWLDDLQLYLLSDSSDSILLFDPTSGASPAPPATADSATRSQWLSRDAAAHLAIRNHLPLAECAHFGEHRTAQTLYDAVVARYSSPATAAPGCLLLPYLFPEESGGASPRLSSRPEPLSLQQLREWFAQRTRFWSGAAGAGDSAAGDTGAGGAGVTARAGGIGGAATAGPGGARTRGTGAAGFGNFGGAGGAGAGGAGAGDTGAADAGAGGFGAGGYRDGGAGAGDTGAFNAGAGGAVSVGTGAGGTPGSPLPAPSPYAEQTDSLRKHREPDSRPSSPIRAVRTGRRVPRPRPPPVPSTHAMALRPSSDPLRVPVPAPPESSLPVIPDPKSDLPCAASPTVSRLLATVVTDPAFESTAASALVAKLVDFAAA